MSKQTSPPLPVVPYVDISRYTGVWYEIARYPHSFQEGCVGSKATYTLRDDGKISVINECYNGTFNGEIRSAKGKAWVVDKETTFFGPLGLGCRFTPTCSEYALEAVRAHGALKGVALSARRLCRCHPWGGFGHDPVPARELKSPV